MLRRTFSLVALVVAVAQAGPAGAQPATPILDRAGSELRNDPVYVDPQAELADRVSADRVRQRITDRGVPVFVAVLPQAAAAEAGGDPREVIPLLTGKVGLTGTYGVVVGNSFRGGPGRAGGFATAAFQAHRNEGLEAVLLDFVERVAAAADGTGGGDAGVGASPSDEGQTSGGDGGGGGGSGLLPLLLLLGAGGGGFYLWQKGKRRREEVDRQQDADRSLLRAEVSVLADDVMRLEPEVTLHPEARDDYEAGVARYRVAQAALEQDDRSIDLVRVQRVVAEGQYAMSRARAVIDGRQPPPPPEELTRRGRRDEPPVDLDDDGRPQYVGYGAPFYGGGWFGGGGGLLTGLFLGQMLGGWGMGGGHYEQNVYVDDSGGGGDDGGWGGGDFGGGDFGGGDFGGGDFGGGDF